jgi:hypothetical protein
MTVKGGGMNEISDAAYKVFGKRKLGAAESFTPGGEGGAGGTWRGSDIAQDIYNLGHEWEKLGGGSSNEVYDFVNKLWVPGIGFKEDPLLAIRMWMYDQWEREDRRLESVIISIQRGIRDWREKNETTGFSFIEQGFIERAVQDGFDKDTGMMTAEGIGPLPPYDWGKEYAKRNAERKGTR